MASAEYLRPPEDRNSDVNRDYLADSDYNEHASALSDIEQIEPADRDSLLRAVANMFANPQTAERLLRSINFPVASMPPWTDSTPLLWWEGVFDEFDFGVTEDPYRRIIAAIHRRYRNHRYFSTLYTRYITDRQQAPAPAPEPTPATCHVIVRASTDEERARAAEVLNSLGLGATEVWTTEHAASFAVNSANTTAVDRTLNGSQLGFTVVPPDAPDYLLRELYVQGPDGSRFRLVDAPAQQTVANVAAEVIAQYAGEEMSDVSRPTVMDRVGQKGELSRVNGEETLHGAGFQDGDNLRVGFEGRAGAVNPIDWQNALDRVMKQLTDFGRSRDDVKIRANSLTLPTEYEIDFVQPSFAPPDVAGGPPRVIQQHTLRITLGPEFPETAPTVFWLTPIFHPNVYPMYDSPAVRDRPGLQGLACLGMLAESWHPSVNFADLVQTLIDIAGYRNYELFHVDTDDAGPRLRANYYDRVAAEWAIGHQAEIHAIGGSSIVPSPPLRPGYPNVIVALD